ncbi:hypothetical protein [Crossiella cryophila]|uniref:Uncharacterized protein n=1 Tax=Crossiella cryophila TaxID=43355 RepID=A0A7W7CF33_9PSEU|nr:hypothetical protein [Crossiella cryophila]MBB4679994.1 hypothetical protein [Crossiella cryophila]
MYTLRAAIAVEPVLLALVGPVAEAHAVPLGQDLFLLPVSYEFIKAATIPGAAELAVFWRAPLGFGAALAACSALGPVAFVEAEIFGGAGTQTAQVWDGGQVVLGPVHLAEKEESGPLGSPISQALRHLGVVKGEHHDEFAAVGLGRHRSTEQWLPSTG